MITDPYHLPDKPSVADEWPFEVPLRWETQLRYLWWTSQDAFEVVATFLSRRAAPSVLGQIRLLLENFAMVLWLTGPEDQRRSRTLGFAMAEIRDLRKIAQSWTERPAEENPMLKKTKQREAALKELAKSEGTRIAHRPKHDRLVREQGGDMFTYNSLSDSGVHSGLSSAILFFSVPEERKIDVNLAAGHIQRAHFLGMAFELHARATGRIADVRGWTDVRERIQAALNAEWDALEGTARLIDQRAT